MQLTSTLPPDARPFDAPLKDLLTWDNLLEMCLKSAMFI